MIKTSAQIRQSFLDFFQSKLHTIVPSSSLMPDSPNLLFTNAGMNQFVPIFLGQTKCPYNPGRAADTQKCIRAGGKHNDLDDVGLDTYHHTFFEMLGNWSFGDYFKKESIEWGWELLTKVWGFPANRLYATVYKPDPTKGDPAEFDHEAYGIWEGIFRAAGLDPAIHIVYGNKKDNFWMMGDTGPCGPCSEIHVDLTPAGDTKGALVNKSSAECIEIWNHVFIQFNANPDGTFSPLPAKHVDTGMGFERATSIIQCTKGFTDFVNAKVSNYETDIFRPIFDVLEKLSGKRYTSTLPQSSANMTEQEKIDVAFRVIADHIRTLSFSIADGILPGNTDRNYVLRRILRRAVRYGRTLGFTQPFFYKLVDVLADTMGDVFPEIRARKQQVQDTIRVEEEAFNRTLDTGLSRFENQVLVIKSESVDHLDLGGGRIIPNDRKLFPGDFAFLLYDTYGFPLDLTELLARENGLVVETARFNELMEQQRARARAAQKKEVIEVSQINAPPTKFVGYDALQTVATVQDIVQVKGRTAVILDSSACYAEMGGQVGDTGEISGSGQLWRVVDTQKAGGSWLHFIEGGDAPAAGGQVQLSVDAARRAAIQRHHTVTHIMHWALHEVVSKDASQKGSSVTPDKLTFDFNSAALTPAQLADIEKLVNERILDNAGVSWSEVPYAEVKQNKQIMQFFGDKYGDTVRVVQIGGQAGAFNGYSMELCGGTHARATGEIGAFRIVAESSVSAGIRRIEAVCGMPAFAWSRHEHEILTGIAQRLSTPAAEVTGRIEAMMEQVRKLEKELKERAKAAAMGQIDTLLASVKQGANAPYIAADVGELDADAVRSLQDALRSKFTSGVIVLAARAGEKVFFLATADEDHVKKGIHCGKLLGVVAKITGGGGGGKPNKAEAGGKDISKIADALAEVPKLV